jgi:hypothetical protein
MTYVDRDQMLVAIEEVLSRGHTAAYDLRNDIQAVLAALPVVEPATDEELEWAIDLMHGFAGSTEQEFCCSAAESAELYAEATKAEKIIRSRALPVLETPAPLTKERLDALIESEFQQCDLDAESIVAEGVARHGAERLKRELMRLGFVGAPVEPVPAPRLTIEYVDDIACQFHNEYERLAPNYGYKTREASAVNWADVPAANKGLMREVVSIILNRVLLSPSVGPS